MIEEKSTGEALIPDLRQDGHKLPVIPMMPEADKETRARTQAGLVESGLVFLPEAAEWLIDYEQQLSRFPNSEHFDQVGSTRQFLRWIKGKSHQAQPSLRRL